MKRVAVIGTGYVGLVTGTCLAEIGNEVVCVDKDAGKIETLEKGGMPIYEPGLKPLIDRNVKNGRLRFSTDTADAVQKSEVIFIAVNTPPLLDGDADLSFVEACTREVARHADGYKLLVEKSTVPVQTGNRVKRTLALVQSGAPTIEVASNPEFLKEGTAVQDFMEPDRLVFGVESRKAENLMRELYAGIDAPVIVTDINSAELIKHASNSFLAMKISYINAIARICERVGADVEQVARGMGLDPRIGSAFLKPGIGYGGSCFPKDVAAFIKIAEKNGYDFGLLDETQRINSSQRNWAVEKLEECLWTLRRKTVAIWGLAFKPETDDIRNAPALDIIAALIERGASVRAYDPVAADRARSIYPDVYYASSPLDAAEGADAVVVATEWQAIRAVDLVRLKEILDTPVMIDGRNAFDPRKMAELGFRYESVGRPTSPSPFHSRIEPGFVAADQPVPETVPA